MYRVISPDGAIFSAITSNKYCVYLYTDDKRLCIVTTEQALLDVDVSMINGVLHLWMSTAGGSIYLITEKQIRDHVDRFNNKTAQQSTEDDIFSDLLDGTSEDDIPMFETSEPVIRVAEIHRVYEHSSDIVSLLVTNQVIFLAYTEQNTIVVQGYSESSFKCQSGEPKTPVFVFTHINSPDKDFAFKSSKKSLLSSKLFLITCGMTPSVEPSCCYSNKCLVISDELFKHLFGADCLMMNSPVLLLISSFRAFSAPLKCLNKDYVPSASNRQLESFTALCSLSSNIVSVNAVTVENELKPAVDNIFEDEDIPQQKMVPSLLISGNDGKCVLFTHIPTAAVKNSIKYVILDGPVLSACCRNDEFFYTSGKRVFACRFNVTAVSKKHQTVERTFVIKTTKKVFHLGRIESLCPLENGKLLCKKCCGEIACFSTLTSSDKIVTQSRSQHDQSSQIRDTLLSMDRTHDETQNLISIKEKCHFVLNQLNLAAHFLASRHHIGKQITCQFSVIQPCLKLEQCELCLVCNITNFSGVSLPANWFVHVSIYDALNQTNLQSDLAIKQRLVKFDRGFPVGCTEKIVLPLSTHLHVENGVLISVSMILDISENIEMLSDNFKSDSSVCFDRLKGIVIKIPVQDKIIDTVDTLRLYRFQKAQHRLPDLKEYIEDMATSRPVYSTIKNSMEKSELSPAKNMKLEMLVSLETVKRISSNKANSSECGEDVLKNLLLDSSLISQSDISRSCDLVTIDGRRILVTVTPDNDGVHIELSSSSVSALATLKQCFLKRLKATGQSRGQEKIMKTSDVQRSLKKLDDLKQNLQTLQQAMEVTRDPTRSQLNDLVVCYENLRSLSVVCT